MSEPLKIALTSLATVTVLVCGQILIRSFIDPLYELKKVVGKIGYILQFYAHILANPGVAPPETERKVAYLTRQAACLLATRSRALSWYTLFAALRLVPRKTEIHEAVKQLIGLSNSLGLRGHEDQIQRRIRAIRIALKLYDKPEEVTPY